LTTDSPAKLDRLGDLLLPVCQAMDLIEKIRAKETDPDAGQIAAKRFSY